jgi:predicted AlkP superfamily phosphohydrolase/phosphomutase
MKGSFHMSKSAKKVILIGLDAPIAHRIVELARAGELPTFKQLLDTGIYAQNCLVPFPTVTPPNWTTIATGAWPSTAGITSFHTHIPGDRYLQEVQSFDHAQCRAETIWEAAARSSKRSIVVNFPSTHGLNVEGGIRLGGASVMINSFNVGQPGHNGLLGLAGEQVFSTDEYLIDSTYIDLRPASEWDHLPDGTRALEADLPLTYRMPRTPLRPKTWHMLVTGDESGAYDRVILSESKDVAAAFATLTKDQWSDNIIQQFQTDAGKQRGAFRCKLTELAANGRHVQLYVTPLCALESWSVPEEVAAQIPCQEGLPLGEYAHFGWGAGWIDTDTLVEVFDLEHRWLAEAAVYLATHKPWDILSVVIHSPDTFHHLLSNLIDPQFTPDQREMDYYRDVERIFYQSVDRAVGDIAALADGETVVAIVSDHGTKATTRRFLPAKVLADAGLTAFKDPLPETGGGEVKTIADVMDQLWPFKAPEPDWSQTRAIAIGECYIYVNLKGRDPDGIVDPADYEGVRDEIIKALYDYTDPRTGAKPITLAVRREEARFFGLHGERVGDVVYAIDPRYGRQHGPAWPTHEIGIGSLNGLFIMAGPGIKQGEMLKRTVHLVDLVPTLCHVADLPVPRDAEGAIIYQALEDPDAKRYELERLRDNFKRLKAIREAERAESHTYNQ